MKENAGSSSQFFTAEAAQMAVSITTGVHGLMQLGVSVSDIALLFDQGKKFGNFLRAPQNDNDLFDILDEDREALLQRRGLVDTSQMEKAWSEIKFIFKGERKWGKFMNATASERPQAGRASAAKRIQDVDGFTWVMVLIVSAIDTCLPSDEIRELLIRVFVQVLGRDDDIETALRIHIRTNVESWRSFGCARGIGVEVQKAMRKILGSHGSSIPQLNDAELKDMEKFLLYLLRSDTTVFRPMSLIVFSVAHALKEAKLHLCTDGQPRYEGQACIEYQHDQNPTVPFRAVQQIYRGLGSRSLQISWPFDRPETMIDALRVDRSIEHNLFTAWKQGEQAASGLKLVGKSDGLYQDGGEVYYVLDVHPNAHVRKKFPPHIGMLAQKGFPFSTEDICWGIESILMGEPPESLEWLQSHIEVNYLLRAETASEKLDEKFTSVFLKYQALLFGFYYQLLRNILSFDLIEPSAFFRGIWGTQSTTFLAMCTQLGYCLRRSERASRAHILYILAAMYNGRRKVFKPDSPVPRLVGVIGSISVLVMPLIRTTDNPEEIQKIAVIDLPIADLSADTSEGELMASDGGGIQFVLASNAGRDPESIKITGPKAKWTVNPHMAISLESERTGGVVMAAQCGTRLVGWFNPLAADICFLGPAYLKEWRSEIDPEAKKIGFEVRDEDWQSGIISRPDSGCDGYRFGIVHSHNSPTLRYAAAGFYGELGEEIAVARSADEFYGAFDKFEVQERGIVIT